MNSPDEYAYSVIAQAPVPPISEPLFINVYRRSGGGLDTDSCFTELGEAALDAADTHNDKFTYLGTIIRDPHHGLQWRDLSLHGDVLDMERRTEEAYEADFERMVRGMAAE